MRIRIQAPAKVNLHLDVLDKRTDGYHNIISLFQSVSFFDTLVIRMENEATGCTIKGDFPFPQEDNIIKKAAEAFLRASGKKRFLEIDVQKRIPIGAGLGGGSSDAAAVISCLNEVLPNSLSEEKITDILQDLGSDVPYFYVATAALVTGRGETVQPLIPRTDYSILIIYPGLQVQTAGAYSWLDITRAKRQVRKQYREKDVIDTYRYNTIETWGFSNSFKEILMQQYPLLESIISDIYTSGALYGNITGSGSALFGLYRKDNEAGAAFGYLKTKYPFVFLTKPLDKIPLPVLY
ncbi:MAG: 4-(cytidine 5'-diphospho)-2-C-methyl-D-erythritol kinase [Spirochaetales bacterium]|nr:4-(cytidine 5'-diphospho)-2-C-methyl-D-erythritol kinase [Spirochaetales bacterium]